MSDSPDTSPSQYQPNELVYDLSKERRTVTREDQEIDQELDKILPRHPDPNVKYISARTHKPVPRYLIKGCYGPALSLVARMKAERICKRKYEEGRLIRDTKYLYGDAEYAFDLWWLHLEDEEDVEIDDESVRQKYIEDFVRAFHKCLESLDKEHPENLEEYHNEADSEREYIEERGDPAYSSIRSKNREYYKFKPHWRQNIAADGRKGGRQAAEEDTEVGMGFRTGEELEKLAQEQFDKVFENLTWDVYFEHQSLLDYPNLRKIYVHNFVKSYAENAGGKAGTVAADEISARVVTTKHDGDSLVYVIEIKDPQNFEEPTRVVVTVDDEGNAEAQGIDDD